MHITHLYHLVLTVENIDDTVRFYVSVLGMQEEVFEGGRVALKFGSQKINLHEAGKEFEPKAHRPTPVSGDLCFITDIDLNLVMEHVQNLDAEIIEGPVRRIGANGPLLSFYFRDPDLNLVEVSNAL
ncbi:MAG: VOC family protein [Desulfomonilaceae bacterium]